MKVAIIGATGAVGREMVKDLEASKVKDVELVFDNASSIEGRVLDVDGVTPVPAIAVELSGGFATQVQTTDALGGFKFELVPQGGGNPRTGHRCPGEQITVAVLSALAVRLARLSFDVPEQDLDISPRRIPARPRSGVVLRVRD